MRRLLVAGVIPTTLATLVLLLAGACSNPANDPPAARETPSAGTFPATVATKFGDVTVASKPVRVVALGWGDAEAALALGVQPVGASDWLAFGGNGVGPWATDLYTAPPTIIGTLEPSFEDVAALAPDLILDVKSSGDQTRYDTLSKIAPTIGVPTGGDSYLTTVDQQTTMIAAALGVPDQGAARLADVTASFADAAAAHPEFAGKTSTVAAFTGDGWGAYISAVDRSKFLYNLGFAPNPQIEAMTPDRFTVPISEEKLDLLDSDFLLVQPIGKTAADVESQPLYAKIPAVADGRSLILDDPDVAKAFSVNSALSIQYAVDAVVPLIAAKVG